MKALIINCNPVKNGATAEIIRIVSEQLSEKMNLFYISCGFKELEVFPHLWDEANLCQIYVMSLI